MTLDVVIRNGRIVDGTGAPWFRGTLGIKDGTIVEVSRKRDPDLSGEVDIDAEQSIIAPGFIDTHSHSDLQLFSDPTLAPKIRQGITTEILGQDGFSMAPMYRDGGAEEWKTQLSALAGDVDAPWSWGSTEEYFAAIEENGVAPNVGMLVGHGTARFNILGMDDRDPSADELEEMLQLVDEALDQGALGLSTGLIYTPATYASTDEVDALAQRLEPYGRPFIAHIRSEGRWIWDGLDEFIDIGAEHDIPLHLSHFKVAGTGQHGLANRAIQQLETARARGVDITAEQYPYDSGSTMLSAILPPWVHADGPDELLTKLEDPEIRDQMRRDIEKWRIEGWENFAGLAGWDNIYITNSPANPSCEGQSVAEIATEHDKDPIDVASDLLLEDELSVSMRVKILAESDIKEILSHELVTIGTDGLFGGEPHPRVYGTYPRILGHYVRDENLLSVEEAIQKMTALPARAMGLQQKGILRPGMDADIVIFNADIVDSSATYDQPQQYPIGISHVLVNGVSVVKESAVTQNTPGEVITQ